MNFVTKLFWYLNARLNYKRLIVVTNTPGDQRPNIRHWLKSFSVAFVGIHMDYREYREKYGVSRTPEVVIVKDGFCNEWIAKEFSKAEFLYAKESDFLHCKSFKIKSTLELIELLKEKNNLGDDLFKPNPSLVFGGTVLVVGMAESQKQLICKVLDNYALLFANNPEEINSFGKLVKSEYPIDIIVAGNGYYDNWVKNFFPEDEFFYINIMKIRELPFFKGGSLMKLQHFLQARFCLGKGGARKSRVKTYVFGMSPWKSYLSGVFTERDMIFLPKKIKYGLFVRAVLPDLVLDSSIDLFVWGYSLEREILDELIKLPNAIWFVEDGFIRSNRLGAAKTPGFSLTIDTQAPYFDATRTSDLEELLGSYDFSSDAKLIRRSRKLLDKILATGVSKYNDSKHMSYVWEDDNRDKKRVVVIGQVEDDASIKWGCDKLFTNNDLLCLAIKENPDAQIVFRPHPDVVSGLRPKGADVSCLEYTCQVMDVGIPLADVLDTVDHVYTITSLVGFEALLRKVKVTVLGCPFYSGWGLTDDRQPNLRRQRRLDVLELLAGCYILYPIYFDPIGKYKMEVEDVIDRLIGRRGEHTKS